MSLALSAALVAELDLQADLDSEGPALAVVLVAEIDLLAELGGGQMLALDAAVVRDVVLRATVGEGQLLALEALLAPDSAITVALAGPSITATLGPYIEVAGSAASAAQLDLSGARYWYLLYAGHIARVDNSGSPVLVQVAQSTDWLNRLTLSYS